MIEQVRAFNRFYTRRIGVISERLLDSAFSLAEMRVLYELAHRDSPTATDLARDLGLDPGYLSRILRRFEARRFVTRTRSADDRRHSALHLTAKGRAAFAPLEQRTSEAVGAMIRHLGDPDQRQLAAAMGTITRLLDPEPARQPLPYVLRAHRPGDMGWVVQRHGELYAREWGYTAEFEALVARICADFLDHFDPTGERCWMVRATLRPGITCVPGRSDCATTRPGAAPSTKAESMWPVRSMLAASRARATPSDRPTTFGTSPGRGGRTEMPTSMPPPPVVWPPSFVGCCPSVFAGPVETPSTATEPCLIAVPAAGCWRTTVPRGRDEAIGSNCTCIPICCRRPEASLWLIPVTLGMVGCCAAAPVVNCAWARGAATAQVSAMANSRRERRSERRPGMGSRGGRGV